MNILIANSWLREYLKTEATPQQIKEYLSLCGPTVEKITEVDKDFVYDIEITSNRVDMASIYGIAREAVAILPRFGIKAELLALKVKEPTTSEKVSVKIEDPDRLCDRLLALALEVEVNSSPDLMKDRLEKSGIRSLNNLIDITNYIMTEIGHPVHVFDLGRIKTNHLLIRLAKKGETLITLDGKKYQLDPQDVVIDDGTGRIIDLPGIMGTENSVVTGQTKRVLLFIESNDPVRIRKTSMRHGIRTVAATINEKHPDPEAAKTALLRGIELLEKHASGKVSSPIYDLYPKKNLLPKISVSVDFINARLGIDLSQKDILNFLNSLNFQTKTIGNNLEVVPPSYRQFDIAIPEDIVEEIARIYGYHLLPNKIMAGEIPLLPSDQNLYWEEKTKWYLKHTGNTEIYNYSFVSQNLLDKTGINQPTLKLSNPLTEELAVLRPSLIPQMLKTLADNQSLKENLRFFELSKVYLPKVQDLPQEVNHLCLGYLNHSYGSLKGVLEGLAQELGIDNLTVKPKDGQSGEVFIENKKIGEVGLVKKNLALEFGLKKKVYLVDLDFEKLASFAKQTKKYQPINPYPPIIQDLAMIVKPQTYFSDLVEEIKKISPVVKKVSLLDQYENTLTLRLIFQDPTKTLEEKDVEPTRNLILKTLEEKFGAKLKTTA